MALPSAEHEVRTMKFSGAVYSGGWVGSEELEGCACISRPRAGV